MEKTKKNKQKIFYLGIVVFALGVVLTSIGYSLGEPLSPYISGSSAYVFPFLNWVTLAGIVIAVFGYVLGKKKRGKEAI